MPARAPSTGQWWRIAPWLVAGVLAAAGLSATGTIAPLGSEAAPTEFSAARAMEHIAVVARSPHPVGSAAIETARRYLIDELTELGLELDLQTIEAPDVYGTGDTVDVVNVIAWIPGNAHTKAVVLMAHYDTFPTSPGANDNTAAVATLLETARALRAGPALANDIVFLFTDAEEPSGRLGARSFAAVPGLVDRLGIVVNFEANGSTGASLLVETSGPESWLIDQHASAAPHPAAFSFLPETVRLLGEIGTDFDVFRDAGVAGLHFAYLRGSPIYHTQADDIASVDPGAVQHHGSHALAIAKHFGNLDLDAIPSSTGGVYFTLGRFVVRYPAAWSLPFALGAIAVWVLALSAWRRPVPVALGAVARSAGTHAAAIVTATVVGTVLWLVVTGLRSSPGTTESYTYGVLVATVAVFVGHRLVARFDGGDPSAARYACISLWAGLAVVTAWTLPGLAYLFVWPALVAAACVVWRPGSPTVALTRFSLVAAVTIMVTAPAIDVFFLLAQPRPGNPDSDLTVVAFVPLVLTLLVAALLASGWHRVSEGVGAGRAAEGASRP